MAYGSLFTYGPPATTGSVDSLLATTRSTILKLKDYFADAVFTRITLLNWLMKNAQVTRQGGASILTPLLFGKNSTFKAYAGDDVIDTTGQEGLTMSQIGTLASHA